MAAAMVPATCSEGVRTASAAALIASVSTISEPNSGHGGTAHARLVALRDVERQEHAAGVQRLEVARRGRHVEPPVAPQPEDAAVPRPVLFPGAHPPAPGG